MAGESGGGANLLGLLKIKGPESGVAELIAGKGQANTREHLIASGLGGVGVVAEQQASRLAGKAYQEWAKINLRREKRGLPQLPMPVQAQYDYGEALRIVSSAGSNLYTPQLPKGTTLGAAAGVYAAQSTSTQPATQPWYSNVDWRGWIETGARVADLVAYFRELFGSRGGPEQVTYTIPGGEMAPSPFPTNIPGGSMPYLLAPGPAMSGDNGILGSIGSLAGGIGSIISAIRGGASGQMPGGAMSLGNYGSVSVFPGSGVRAMVGDVLATAAGQPGACRVGGNVGIVNPATGKMVWFRRAGVPVLWSGDKAAAKRWGKCHPRRRSGGC